MNQGIQILNSKLTPPQPTNIIKRQKLYPLIAEIPKKRLTAVIAGAGFGKTTLIAEAARYLDIDVLWYRLDKTDRDFMPFMCYLVAGMNKRYIELGVETLRTIEAARDLNEERNTALIVFLSEIEKYINRDILIVLDDYHLVQESEEINEAMKFFIDNLPALIHIVIISRMDPVLHLSRFRARREMLDIREDNLRFTIHEIAELYSQLFNITLENKSIMSLYKKTEGWISGLMLFYHSLQGKKPEDIDQHLAGINHPHKIISEYLEKNVYGMQPDEIKDFLIKTSILSRINPEFCGRLMGINNSRDILTYLEKSHLFTFPFDDERKWRCYHKLFRDFLQRKLTNEMSRKDIFRLHTKAAALWEEYGEEEEALSHYMTANQLDKAWYLLRKLGARLFKEGRVHLIDEYLDKIPDSFYDKEPWTQYMRALAMEVSSNPQEAIQIYDRALNIFLKHESSTGVVLTLNSLGYNSYIEGNFKKAEIKLKELRRHVTGNPRSRVDVLINLMFVSYLLGKFANCDKYYRNAMSLLPEVKDDKCLVQLYLHLGNRHIFSGDFIKALKLGKQLELFCENAGLYAYLIGVYQLISYSYYFSGLFSMGMEYAQKCMELVKEKRLHDYRAVTLMCSAFNAIGLGKIKEAIKNAEECLTVFQDIGSRWLQARAYYILSSAYNKSGNLTKADECSQSGLKAIEGLTLPLEEGMLKYNLAKSLITRKQYKEARPLLEYAEKRLNSSKFYAGMIYLLYARLHWEQRQKEAALDRLASALQLCEENQYDIWVVSEKNWIIPLLVEIYARGNMRDYLHEIFKKIGLYAGKELTRLRKRKNTLTGKTASNILAAIGKAPPPSLRVYCFGKFRLFRGDEEIIHERWKSNKARMLFKYLLHMRRRGYLSKEILMEFLWPEDDPEKTLSRLHVVLPGFRKTLEPELSRGTSSSYILREKNSYKLYTGDEGWVDVDEFERELEQAKMEKNPDMAIQRYLKAESIYTGDYLQEDIFEEWCMEERANLREKHQKLLNKIMKYFELKHEYIKCIDYARKYLAVNKYDENIYQDLMKYYSLIDNNSMVLKTFEVCKKNIIEGLDSQLSEKTELLFHNAASGRNQISNEVLLTL